ncbi:helix-turn-helix domain-containing protein [Lacrimispora sp. JR3]|uniref:helix-turn-helix domain-containing protein n=1 Tax=Lacrimispora sinapis TaxID=3111456 RepID=UPI00374832E3
MLYGNIKNLCDKKNIPISQLERNLEFPRSSICKWDENEPSVWRVQKVAKLLGVTVDSLLEDSKETQQLDNH